MVKIGIIGAGKIARKHAAALAKIGVSDIVVADRLPEAADTMAAEFDLRAVPRTQDILQDPQVTAVDVCVPPSDHAIYVIAALEAGKSVFCEKPLCLRLTDALRIQDLSAERGLTVAVGYPYRFYPSYRYVKRLLDEEIIGVPDFALLRLGGRGSQARWKYRAGEGGAGIEMMVHMLDLVFWLFGPVSSLRLLERGTVRSMRHIGGVQVSVDADDYIITAGDAGSTRFVIESDLLTPSYMNHLEIHGENGSIFTSILSDLPTRVFCREARGGFAAGVQTQSFPYTDVFELEWRQFLASIEGLGNLESTLAESIRMVRLLEALETTQTLEVSIAGAQ